MNIRGKEDVQLCGHGRYETGRELSTKGKKGRKKKGLNYKMGEIINRF